MVIGDDITVQDFQVSLQNFIDQEKIPYRIFKKNQLEFWIEALESDIIGRVIIDDSNKRIFYDIYSVEDEEHLNSDSIKDVEKIGFIEETRHNWKAEVAIEDIWLIIEEIRLWAFKNGYEFKEKELM